MNHPVIPLPGFTSPQGHQWFHPLAGKALKGNSRIAAE